MADRAIWWGMVALAALYVAVTFQEVRVASLAYGPLAPDLTHAEVRYIMGRPTTPAGADWADAAQWTYHQGSARTIVDFDPERVETISCTDSEPRDVSCPSTLGFGLATPEDEIWHKLGVPSSQTYRGNVKRITYDELGLSFELERLTVTAITLQRRPGPFSFVSRAVRALLP